MRKKGAAAVGESQEMIEANGRRKKSAGNETWKERKRQNKWMRRHQQRVKRPRNKTLNELTN